MLEQKQESAEVVWDDHRRASAKEEAVALTEIDARSLLEAFEANPPEPNKSIPLAAVIDELGIETSADALWHEIFELRQRKAMHVSRQSVQRYRLRKRIVVLTAAAMSLALVGWPFLRVHAIERQAKRSAKLMSAIHSDDVIDVERVLAHGADPNAVTVASPYIAGWKQLLNPMTGHIPALTVAVSHCNLPVVDALLRAGANAGVRDELGATPLHWLAGRTPFGAKELGVMKLLIAHGADIRTLDGRGRTALDFAKNGGNEEFAKALTGLTERAGK